MVHENWCRKETLILIKLLKHFPCLYNPEDPDFTNLKLRNQRYTYIVSELKKRSKGDFTVQNVKNKHRTLRSQVSKEKKNIRNFFKDGNNKNEIYKPKLWCFHELAFLFKVVGFSKIKKKSLIKIKEEVVPPEEVNNSYGLIENNLESDPEFIEEIGTEQTSESEISSEEICVQNVINNLTEEVNHTKIEVEKDSQEFNSYEGREEAFCKYLATELKRLKHEDLFYELKIDILQVVRDKVKQQNFDLNHHDPLNI